MDPVSAVGLASNIAQSIEFCAEFISRLQEFRSNVRDVPKTYREIKTRMPLLLNLLERIQNDLDNGEVDRQTELALLPIVQDCTNQVKSLKQMLMGTLPAPDDSQWRIVTKTFISLWQEKKIQGILSTISAYQGDLVLFRVTSPPRTSDVALERQRSPVTWAKSRNGSLDSLYPSGDSMVQSTSLTRQQATPRSPETTLMSTTSSRGSPTETIFDSRWSTSPTSTARTDSTGLTAMVSSPQRCQTEPATIEVLPRGPPLLLPEPAITRPQRIIEAQMTYTPEGGSKRSMASRLEFGKINDGHGNVTSVLWTGASDGAWKCHELSQSDSNYPHTEHPEGDSQTTHIVSFLGRQVLLEQKAPAERAHSDPETSLLARQRPPRSDLISTGTIDYSFQSHQDLQRFRQIIFGKTLLICVPVNKISVTETECETETLSLWESCDVRTVVYFASAKSAKDRKHVELEVVSSNALKDYTKSPPGLTLKVKANHINQRANSVSSIGSGWNNSSKSKGKDYLNLKIKFGSMEDRDRFAKQICH